MQKAPFPLNDAARVAALRALDLLDTAADERFDRLTRIAQHLFDTPIAKVSLVDADRQWFKSCIGLSQRETPREISFCGHAILSDELLIVEDALADPRFADSPLVLDSPHARFYAGCPLKVGGFRIGTICVVDTKPRSFDDEARMLLRDLGSIAEQQIAMLQLATTDSLTGLLNRRGFEARAPYALEVCKRAGLSATLLFFDLDRFKPINDSFGHAEGDRALAGFAHALRSALRETDIVARSGGDEFVALLIDADEAAEDAIVKRIRSGVEQFNEDTARGYRLGWSVGRSAWKPTSNATAHDLLVRADKAMYEHKRRTREA
jgi:diguanylate cyclase (GGDEF)-like protein